MTTLKIGDPIIIRAKDPARQGFTRHEGRFRAFTRGGAYIKYDWHQYTGETAMADCTVTRADTFEQVSSYEATRAFELAALQLASPLRPIRGRTEPVDNLALFGGELDLFA